VTSYGAGSGLLRQPTSASPWWGLAAACVSLRRLTAASAPPTLQPGRFAGQGYASFFAAGAFTGWTRIREIKQLEYVVISFIHPYNVIRDKDAIQEEFVKKTI